MDYFSDLPIDDLHLQGELKNQHLLFAKWSSEYATAYKRAQEAKILLAEKEAELRSLIRKELDDQDIRATEGLLNERVQLNSEYKTIKRRLIKANYEEEQAKGAKESFRMRKDLLLQLCVMLGMDISNTYERIAKQLDGRKRK